MYRVNRTDKEVKVLDARGGTVFAAPLDSYIIWGDAKTVTKVTDLDDAALLKALVEVVTIRRDLDKG